MATPAAAHNSVTVSMQKTLGGLVAAGLGDTFPGQMTVMRLFVCVGNGAGNQPKHRCLVLLNAPLLCILLHFMSARSAFDGTRDWFRSLNC